LGLRRSAGIDVDALGSRLDLDLAAIFARSLEQVVTQGLAFREGSTLRLTPRGQLFGNSVGEAFLGDQ
jgi:oxygen-independent coproporphyrinogen-3 oxidase